MKMLKECFKHGEIIEMKYKIYIKIIYLYEFKFYNKYNFINF